MSDMSAPMGSDQSVPDAPDTGTPDGASEAPQSDQYQERLAGRLEEMSKSNAALLESFQQLQSRFDEPEPEEDPYSLEEGDDGYDEQEAQRWLDERIEAKARELVTPLQEQQELAQRDSAYDSFIGKYAEMQDPEFAKGIVSSAAEWAEELGVNVNNPKFVSLIERTYKAHVADQRAGQETPAGSRREVQLESAAGAAPADREEDIQDAVIKAAQSMQFP